MLGQEIVISFYRMLDDFGHEMDNTQSKLDNVMKKLAKVSHMTNGEERLVHIDPLRLTQYLPATLSKTFRFYPIQYTQQLFLFCYLSSIASVWC